ncbi:MAG TPA: ROK family protein [Gemmatimonadales bacterium]|nr:ROK family protein [Gemmatimonadales bacterium]
MQRTLSLDIGGTHLKAAIVAPDESFLSDRVMSDTPDPIDPPLLIAKLGELAERLPEFDRVAAGFPGMIRHGVIRTAPNLGTAVFAGFDLRRALEDRFGRPARVANDADIQGLGAIHGNGMEMVITLGTGFGTAIFQDGVLGPHLELAHHPFHHGRTYEDLLGDAALKRDGEPTWRASLRHAVEQLRALTAFDHLYIGGGNARLIDPDSLPADVSVVPNSEGIAGGVWLWERRGTARGQGPGARG